MPPDFENSQNTAFNQFPRKLHTRSGQEPRQGRRRGRPVIDHPARAPQSALVSDSAPWCPRAGPMLARGGPVVPRGAPWCPVLPHRVLNDGKIS